MNRLKIWPHLVLVAVTCATVSGLAAAWWVGRHQNSEAAPLQSAARLARVDGHVGINRSPSGDSGAPWLEATENTPVTAGDRLYAPDKSRAMVAFTGRNFARLNPRSALDVMYLSPERTQVALRDGSAIFDVDSLVDGGLFEVGTPTGAIDLDRSGLYQVGLDDNGGVLVSVLNGIAHFIGPNGATQVGNGEMLTIPETGSADVLLSRIDNGYAANVLNDYYSYRYPQEYDGRYNSYDAYLSDPTYYEPYRRYSSYRYVSDSVPGIDDLDPYGDWQDVSGYGYCWHPRVDQNWAPYRNGYWDVEQVYGPTWVSNEPWGYAPYHYGRWAFVGNQWFWVPERPDSQPVYSPALVAFLPVTQSNQIGWVPLGPGDPYVPTYYDASWHPHYVGGAPVPRRQVVNINVPGAVTVVQPQNFTRVLNDRVVTPADARTLPRSAVVANPMTVDPIRQSALNVPLDRRRVDLPPAVAQRLQQTPVITTSAPPASPFRPALAQVFRVQPLTSAQRQQKLQVLGDHQPAVAKQQSQPAPSPVAAQPPVQAAPTRGRAAADRTQNPQGIQPQPARAERPTDRAQPPETRQQTAVTRPQPQIQAQPRADRRQQPAVQQQARSRAPQPLRSEAPPQQARQPRPSQLPQQRPQVQAPPRAAKPPEQKPPAQPAAARRSSDQRARQAQPAEARQQAETRPSAKPAPPPSQAASRPQQPQRPAGKGRGGL